MHSIRIGTVIIIKSNRGTVETRRRRYIFYATTHPIYGLRLITVFDIFDIAPLSFLDETISSRLRNNRRCKRA